MSLFARRVVQRYLDSSAAFIPAEKLRDWVRRLNKVSRDYVATEWEVVLVSAIGQFGRVEHERPLGRRPIDLVFESRDGTLKFGADIAAISDESLHERNPIQRLRNEFNRRVVKAGIRSGRFVFRVEEQQPVGRDEKRRLLLPPAKDFGTLIFNAAFDDYIRAVQKEPLVPRGHLVGHQASDLYISIEYQSGKGCGVSSYSHGSYTSTTVKDNNPLFNALKSKAGQLRESGYDGLRGIIVCDGGSRIFTETTYWGNYSMDQVVQEFFRQNTSVSFVVTIGIRAQRPPFGGGVQLIPEPRLFVRRADQRQQWAADLDRLLQQGTGALPAFQQTPENVRISMDWNRSTKRTRPYYGGAVMSNNEIKMSSRELLDLLAGKLDYELFAKRYDLGGGNLFKLFRDRGRIISSAAIEHRPDEDDDWVILRFKDGDPAMCDFREPNAQPPSA